MRWAGLAMALGLAGCDNTDYSPTNNMHYRPWPGLVQVTDKLPDRYVPLGVITAHGSWNATETSLLQQLKERAAGIGANVIVLQGGRSWSGSNTFFMPEYDMSALAIRTVQ